MCVPWRWDPDRVPWWWDDPRLEKNIDTYNFPPIFSVPQFFIPYNRSISNIDHSTFLFLKSYHSSYLSFLISFHSSFPVSTPLPFQIYHSTAFLARTHQTLKPHNHLFYMFHLPSSCHPSLLYQSVWSVWLCRFSYVTDDHRHLQKASISISQHQRERAFRS